MPSFKRPSSPFGRKSPTPVEEPSEEPEVNERTVVFSPEPEAAPEPEPEPEPAAPEPAEPAIPETDETHLAAAKLQASVRGRNARKKTKRRKRPPRSDEGPRTSADIRQEIAELDEEGFREDAARNAQAAKIQARIRGRKARREAAPKRAALQRARADARALADKVAALEAENARLRQAASPPSGAKTPNTEDDWEQCVDETTGHTYYYSSSRDASRWEMPSAWKEGGPKDDWEQC